MNPCTVVLIVEDDESIRETMQLALELRGYEVVTAGNGKEGIETLLGIPRPCLILLDLMMPVMDGWGFVKALEDDPLLDGIPVVVVTAFANQATSINARSVLAKPVPLEVLYATVGEHCGPGQRA
ncbi:MAG: response regulator [Labilithrix sp.]|nr:response regulator [Labilithrix sp.]